MIVTNLQTNKCQTVSSFYSNRVTEKIKSITKGIINYSVQNQYALSLSIWSFGVIQCCLAFSENSIPDNYVYNVDSCRRVLCDYEARNNNPNSTEEELFNLVNTCLPISKVASSYSFYDCLTDLCSFLYGIGEKFYACADQDLFVTENSGRKSHIRMNHYQASFWNKVCPKRHLLHLSDIKLLNYFTSCLKRICSHRDILAVLPDFKVLSAQVDELCNNNTVGNFHNTLQIISQYLSYLVHLNKQGQKDDWKISNGVSNIIVAISSVLGIVAAVAIPIFTHRAIVRVAVAVESSSASLGLQQIARLANHSVRTLIQQTIDSMIHVLPREVTNVMNNLDRALQEDSFSVYYSAEEGSVELAQGNPNGLSGGGVGGGAISEVVASHVGSIGIAEGNGLGVAGKVVDTVGSISKVAINVLGSGNHPHIFLASTTEDSLRTIRDNGEIINPTISNPISDDYCIRHYISNSAESSILNLWIDCLKESLPVWNDSYCFYNRAVNFLACKLPTKLTKRESFIEFYSVTMHKFFAEHKETLCHIFNEEIWCNWNKFLDLSFVNRSLSFFYDEECPWDQFALKIAEPIGEFYKIEATGGCYNQTTFVKV